MRLVLNSYFKTIKVTGKEHIPTKGPIVFVANHPSTLMDPVVIASIVKQQLYFLAAAEFMGKGVLKWAMGTLFNMIPIYRASTQPGKLSKNTGVFDKCYEHLENQGSILIFPEGVSITQKRLSTLKTGTARMVIAAEQQADIKVQIVPIGLNYTDPHTFQTELFVRIGKPITTDVGDLQNIENDFEKATALTSIIEERLKENLIHLDDDKLELIFEKIQKVSHHEYHSIEGVKPKLATKFKLGKEIQEGLVFYNQKHPEVLDIILQNLDTYIMRASFYGISDASISKGSAAITIYDYLRIILGIPIFVFGYITNSLPYYFSIWLVRKMKINGAFLGAVGLSIGFISYLIWYIGWGIFASQVTNFWWAGILLSIIVYLSGRFTLLYLRIITKLRQQGRLNNLLKRKGNIYQSLVDEREQIMTEIMMYAKRVE